MNNVTAIIGESTGNPITIDFTANDPLWSRLEKVTVSFIGATLSGLFEVREIKEQGNDKTYWLMPMP